MFRYAIETHSTVSMTALDQPVNHYHHYQKQRQRPPASDFSYTGNKKHSGRGRNWQTDY